MEKRRESPLLKRLLVKGRVIESDSILRSTMRMYPNNSNKCREENKQHFTSTCWVEKRGEYTLHRKHMEERREKYETSFIESKNFIVSSLRRLPKIVTQTRGNTKKRISSLLI